MDTNVIEYNNYGKFKEEFDTEIKAQANSFVRVGYLLKVARDTNILYESGYQSVAEFAWNEYHLKKDAVSRYIAINDKYSVNGYSEQIQEEYSEYGFAKLGEMLTLPQSVVEMMSPKLTREVIQELKRELKEEEKISDIEVALEPVKPEMVAFDTLAGKLLYEYFHHEREIYKGLYEGFRGSNDINDIEDRAATVKEWMAPSGIAVITERISGIGKILLTIKEESGSIEVLNIRANEKETYSWTEFIGELAAVLKVEDVTTAAERWTRIYGEPFEKMEEKETQVQQESLSNSTKTEKTATKVQKREEKPQAQSNSTKTDNLEEKKLEGQAEITEYFDDKGDYRIPEETEGPVEKEENAEVAPVQQETAMITLKSQDGVTYMHDGNVQVAAEEEMEDSLELVMGKVKEHLLSGGTVKVELL